MNIQIVTSEAEDKLIAELQAEAGNSERPEDFVSARWHAQWAGEIEARDRAAKNALAQFRSLPPAIQKQIKDSITAEAAKPSEP